MAGKSQNDTLLTNAARTAPPSGEDARNTFTQPEEDVDWMSKSIQRQRVENLSNSADKFINDWLLSGYTIDELVTHIERVRHDKAKGS